MAQTVSEQQWPPRSPLDALKSTPGGRDRLRKLTERTSPSPSPVKCSISTSSFKTRSRQTLDHHIRIGNIDEAEDEEDEETLQLQLQEIQARIKLKRLQKAKGGNHEVLGTENEFSKPGASRLSSASSVTRNYLRSDLAEVRQQMLGGPRSQANVHVPASPTRKAQPVELPKSPGRVVLGIDKGLKGGDVSLRKAPSLRKPPNILLKDTQRTAGHLQRASSQPRHFSYGSQSQEPESEEGTRATFSERMTSIRIQEADKREKESRIRRMRNKTFDIDEREIQAFKEAAADLPEFKTKEPEFSRDQILNAYNKAESDILRKSKSTTDMASFMRTDSENSKQLQNSIHTKLQSPAQMKGSKSKAPNASGSQSDKPEFEPFSSLHLSKRFIPHSVVTRTLAGKKTFAIPDLLKNVKTPDFRLPDVEEDVVLIAVIASKSEPRAHKTKNLTEERGKYMVMCLVDLKWELELYLFNGGFNKFWKLTPGTIIAILNPTILPPKNVHTGRFSLVINSDSDTILEIGTARDLGYCKTVKKDGKLCDSWIDKRHTEYCEFHINETLKKTKSGRMEVNTMNFGPKTGLGNRYIKSHQIQNVEEVREEQRRKEGGISYNKETQSTIYVSKTGHNSAVLTDDGDVDAFSRGINKSELLRRRLAEVEKERDIARKLGEIGGGMGADYMRLQNQSQPVITAMEEEDLPPLPDAAALGLLDGKGEDIHLSPIKRKRGGMSSSSAIGWGGNLTKQLGRMKDGEHLQPVKKKTRFVTAKGIREAGRESFGGEVLPTTAANDDDDDDLDIVK